MASPGDDAQCSPFIGNSPITDVVVSAARVANGSKGQSQSRIRVDRRSPTGVASRASPAKISAKFCEPLARRKCYSAARATLSPNQDDWPGPSNQNQANGNGEKLAVLERED